MFSILLYRIFLGLYWCGALVLAPVNVKAKRWLSGRRNVFSELTEFVKQPAGPVIWFHCASLGEFEQARPLVEKMRINHAGHRIVLSFFSPSGYEVRKDYKGADYVTYLPVDSPANARRFLELLKPALVIWVKYEYWHFFLHQIKQQRIPLLLVSGIFRTGQPFFKNWGSFHRSMLGCFTWFFVQTQESKKLLGGIGLSDNVTVSGDTRFDRVIEIAAQHDALPIIERFIGNSEVIVAGSTWEEDEEELDHFANTHPKIKFIIAPHEIDEEHLKDIEKLFHHSIRYSSLQQQGAGAAHNNNGATPPNTLIIDNMGMLSRLYKYASITYIGGGFGNDGVHNVLEAAVYSKPIIFGPVYEKYIEAVELVDADAAFPIDNALELESRLKELLADKNLLQTAGKAAGDYVYANRGATQKILAYIQEKRLLTS